MPQANDLSVVLPPQLASLVLEAVAAGEYPSSAAVIEEALRDWTTKRQVQQTGVEELRRLWEEARSDESPGVPAREVMDRLQRKFQASRRRRLTIDDSGVFPAR